ncbi:MAG: ATP-binding protein [Gammaproteobacteria bacterium]|nr:ATP-binding protein [Gammaproteobacteria bacterium]
MLQQMTEPSAGEREGEPLARKEPSAGEREGEPLARKEPLIPRHAEAEIRRALSDTRIVAVVGPRQSGKTTLARGIAQTDDRAFVTLDNEQDRRFALDDPLGFVRGHTALVIDEIQRAPGLILALKQAVDEDPRPGRFLITGSVDLFKGSISPDSLAGRVETMELLPFSQAELARARRSRFIDRAFANDFPAFTTTGATPNLIDRVLAGGFPEAVSRDAPDRRNAWLRAYARSLAQRDIAEIAVVGKHVEMSRLIDHAAVSAGTLLNMTNLGSRLNVDGKTVDRWLTLLEQMFLVRRVRAWHRSDLKRLVRTPKLHFLDSGLLAALRRKRAVDIGTDRGELGALLECFVHAELAKVAALADEPTAIYHYRDKDRIEVDFVLERIPGMIVGIEVKASATVRPEDFRGLRRLKDAVGDLFACGILLHDGERIQRTAQGLLAMPVKALWEA